MFSGISNYYCNICKDSCDSNFSSKIFRSPYALILILERNKKAIFDIKIDIKETIDITEFVLEKDKPNIIYNLYGVISIITQNDNLYYVASCKSLFDNKWYRINDYQTKPILDIKEIFDYGIPYILFYQKQ